MAEIRMETLHFHVDGHLIEKRRVAMAYLQSGERVSQAIIEAAKVFRDEIGREDCFAFVRSIPVGADEFAEIVTPDGAITLILASWMPPSAVAVGWGGQPVRPGIPVGRERPYMEVANG